MAEVSRRYPERPIVGVGAIIVREHPEPAIVLVKRGNPPLVGEWTIPGGMLELGESLEVGAVREAAEETGLSVQPVGMVEVFDRIYRDADGAIEYHYVLIDQICSVASGELRSGGDAVDARWFAVTQLNTPGVSDFTAGVARRAIARYLDRARPDH
jgi:ADP-ribose pyrophosphatase YjhB (NUDIX family)